MVAIRRIRADRSPNRAARLRQEHNTLLARMPPDTMCIGLATAAARGIQACGQGHPREKALASIARPMLRL
jgi:hypothetical protein